MLTSLATACAERKTGGTYHHLACHIDFSVDATFVATLCSAAELHKHVDGEAYSTAEHYAVIYLQQGFRRKHEFRAYRLRLDISDPLNRVPHSAAHPHSFAVVVQAAQLLSARIEGLSLSPPPLASASPQSSKPTQPSMQPNM